MKNVINDDGTELVPHIGIDNTYNIILNLKNILPNFDKYLFILYNHNESNLPISRNFKHDKKVLFWEAGERKNQAFSEIRGDYHCIFTHYHKSIEEDNIYSIPLGYFTSDVKGDIVDFSEKLYNRSFMGCLNKNRAELASLLSNKSKKKISKIVLKEKSLDKFNHELRYVHNKDFFYFTNDFNKGLEKERYSHILRNSKLVFCPTGFLNAETFRMYEAMKFGCAVISEKLPDREYYKNTPIIEVRDWEDGLMYSEDLLSNSDKLKKLGNDCKLYYDTYYSPKAVAKYIKKTLKKL